MIRSRLEDELARSEFIEDGISEEEAQDPLRKGALFDP
jgi:hypothetical protein